MLLQCNVLSYGIGALRALRHLLSREWPSFKLSFMQSSTDGCNSWFSCGFFTRFFITMFGTKLVHLGFFSRFSISLVISFLKYLKPWYHFNPCLCQQVSSSNQSSGLSQNSTFDLPFGYLIITLKYSYHDSS